MKNLIRSMVLLFCTWLPALHAADSGWLNAPQNDHAEVRFRSSTENGKTRLLLDIRLQPGWKTYWRSPGEGGVAPSITWKTSVQNVNWFWPVPSRFDVSGLTTQGYNRSVSLPITLNADTSVPLSGTLRLPTCSNVCIVTDIPFTLNLQDPASANFETDYARAAGQIPLTSGLTESVQAGYTEGELTLVADRDDNWLQPEIFLDNPSTTMFGKPEISVNGKSFTAKIPVTDEWGDAPLNLVGSPVSLVIADSGIAQHSIVPVKAGPVATSSGWDGFWHVAVFAILGGLILNLMPCVLPVLAMKLSTLVQAEGQTQRQTRQQFLASSAGIVSSFVALALFMTMLRLSGEALGWGIQFQNSGFLLFMVAVTFVFTASLFDLLHIRLPSRLSTMMATSGGNGNAGHFTQGAFATLLATPCTAPFLGTAIAWALTASLPVLWLLFILMGLGMSLPWLLIALFPGLSHYLPKPGRWMITLRNVLALMMLASCLWLLSLLVSHWGITIVAALATVMVLVMAVWLLKKGNKLSAVSVIVVLLAATTTQAVTQRTTGKDVLNWQPLSEAAIQQALSENKRVFIDVTADWCITCKVNKKRVLNNEAISKTLSEDDIVLLQGDWSHADPVISDFLKKRGSVAVPFNQIYGPTLRDGVILKPLLSVDEVLTNLDKANKKNDK